MKKLWTLLAVVLMTTVIAAGSFAADADKSANATPPTIKGVILDKNGKPIKNVQAVGVRYAKTATGWTTLKPEKISVDKNGRFVYEPKGLSEAGCYTVTATADGYACGSDYYRTDRPRGNGELKIVLKPGYTLKGRVVDEAGKPVSGAKVSLESCYGYSSGASGENISGGPNGVLCATTDKAGKFAIANILKPTDYEQYYVSLGVSKPGRAAVEANFHRRDSEDDITGGVTVKQPVECKAEGVLYLPGKTKPAPAGTQIAAVGPSRYGWTPRMCKTDKDGKFHLNALPPGKNTFLLGPGYSLDGNDQNKQEWVLPAVTRDVKPGGTTKLELVAEQGALVKGQVKTKKGEPAKGAELIVLDRCIPAEGSSNWHSLTCDKNGEFTVRVASGPAGLGVQRWNDTWYNPDEMPKIDLKLANGEDKSNVAITIDDESIKSSSSSFDYSKATKSIPNDFALTSGVYDLKWDPDVDCSSAIQSYSIMRDSKIKAALKGLPKLVSTKARYFACRFDGKGNDGELVIILDESQGTDKGYDTAYVDYNRNWDLSDDKPISFTTPKNYRQIYTDYFTLPLRQSDDAGKISERTVQARLGIYGDGSSYVQAGVSRKGAWKGTVESNKGKIECVVVDSDCNGICGEPAQFAENGDMTKEGDFAFLDTNGAGDVIPYAYGSHGIKLYQTTKVGSKFYNIKTSSLGDKIIIEPYTGAMGTLLVRGTNIRGLKADAKSLEVYGAPGCYKINNTTAKTVSLPIGIYHVDSCDLAVKSKDSRTCNMDCKLIAPVEVNANTQSTVDIGGKLSMAISPDEKNLTWRPGQSATLQWVIKIDNSVTLNSLGNRSSSSDSPVLKFLDSKGKLVHTAKVGYT